MQILGLLTLAAPSLNMAQVEVRAQLQPERSGRLGLTPQVLALNTSIPYNVTSVSEERIVRP